MPEVGMMMGYGLSRKVHELKIHPEYYSAVMRKEKRFEIRRNDRDFKVGDVLLLREWNPDTEDYTGWSVSCDVTYITYGGVFGLDKDWCVMSIKLRGVTPGPERT